MLQPAPASSSQSTSQISTPDISVRRQLNPLLCSSVVNPSIIPFPFPSLPFSSVHSMPGDFLHYPIPCFSSREMKPLSNILAPIVSTLSTPSTLDQTHRVKTQFGAEGDICCVKLDYREELKITLHQAPRMCTFGFARDQIEMTTKVNCNRGVFAAPRPSHSK